MKPHKLPLPHIARLILNQFDSCWIVGSAAEYVKNGGEKPIYTMKPGEPILIRDNSPRDWDVVCTCIKEWIKIQAIVMSLPNEKVTLNSFGGYKIQTKHGEVDLWVQDLASLMLRAPVKHLYHFPTNTYWNNK